MAWLETIKSRSPAMFRDATFQVRSAGFSGGRRKVKHEFPQKDLPYFEDMGRINRAFSVEGYVLGEDYLQLKEDLITALENPDIGTLVHPYYGIRQVVALPFEVTESSEQGGIAIFSMSFQEAEEPEQVKITLESVEEELAAKADELQETVEDAFVADFSVEGLPTFFVNEAAALVDNLSEAYEAGMQYIAQAEEFAQDTARYIKKVQNLAEKAVSFVNDPLSLVREITSIYDDVLAITNNATDLFNYFESLFDYGDDFAEVPLTTSTREQQKKNQDALVDLVKALSVGNAARVAGQKEYESDEEAAADRDILLEEIENIIVETTNDDIFLQLNNFKFSIVKLVSTVDVKIVNIQELVSVPEMVLAWRLYRNSEVKIATRNNIDHPGFLLGDLKVLSDV